MENLNRFLEEIGSANADICVESTEYYAHEELNIPKPYHSKQTFTKYNGHDDLELYSLHLNDLSIQLMNEIILKINASETRDSKLHFLNYYLNELQGLLEYFDLSNPDNLKHRRFIFTNSSFQEENMHFIVCETDVQGFYKLKLQAIDALKNKLAPLIQAVEKTESQIYVYKEDSVNSLKEKVKLNISVPQLAVFLNIISDSEIVSSKSRAKLEMLVRQFFSTIETDQVALDSLRQGKTKFTQHAKNYWKVQIEKFQSTLNSLKTACEDQGG